jgi:outer membrane murein-binding lipoprotein Lpp
MIRVLNVLLVTALVAPLLLLSGCCSDAKDDCYDKTSGTYSK